MEQELEYYKHGFFGRLRWKLTGFLNSTYALFLKPGSVYKTAGRLEKAAIILSYPFMGLGQILRLRIEAGLGYMLYCALYIFFMIKAGWGAFAGQGPFSTLPAIGILITLFLTALFLYLYPKSVSDTVKYIKCGKRGKSITARLILLLAKAISGYAFDFKTAYRNGSPRQKAALICGFTLPGISGLISGKIIISLIKLTVCAGYAAYMLFRGAADITGFITLRTEGVKSNYNIVYGLVALLFTLAFVAYYLYNAVNTLNCVSLSQKGKQQNDFKQTVKDLGNRKLYIAFLTLPVIGILIFNILPLIYMISVAFTDFATTKDLGVIPDGRSIYLSWTGFATFVKLFSLDYYFKAFFNVLTWTLLWAVLATFTCYLGGLGLAMLINKRVVKCKILFRSLFVLSMAVPQLVTLRVMYAMFHTQGPINALLTELGWINKEIAFWGNANIAKTLIIFINMWVGIPYFMLLMSGLLLNIPQDLYEYARTEGAGKMQIFMRITMPYLLFMTAPLIITNFVGNINNFNVIWLLTGGAPAGQGTGGVAGGTDILITWLYKLTMQHNPDYNAGSAIGIIMFIITATVSLIIYRNSASYKREGDFN